MKNGHFWGPIPVYILQDHRHRAGHLRVLGAILSCPSPHFPSLLEIAERSGHTPKYCSNMISQMVKFGSLEREQRYNTTNVYRLLGYTTGVDSTTDVDSDSTTDVELKEQLKEKKEPSFGASNGTPKGTSNGVLKGYGYFCSLYPKHRLGSPRELKDYWIVNKLERDFEHITSVVKHLSEQEDWKKNNGMYVPRALKFLDERRWTLYDSDDPLKQFEED
tara:strand:- start:69 stop:725 length:657 start_codon:yes stop_codon:yes gene_type:complete